MKRTTRYLMLAALCAWLAGCLPHGEQQPASRPLTATSSPAGAEVLVDGRVAGRTPLQVAVDVGEHFLEVRQTGYETQWRRVAAGTVAVEFAPQLARRTVVLSISSAPAGASVSIDGSKIGQTPLFLPRQPLGVHDVRFELAGYDTRTRKLTLSDARPRRVHERLGSVLGALRIFTDPPGAAVYIDDALRGTTPGKVRQPLIVGDLPEGQYLITAKHPGRHDVSQTVVLRRHEDRTVRLPQMIELPGAVVIESVPPGATVYRDDQLIGRTPMTLKDLSRTTLRLRFEHPGFDPVVKSVGIDPGQTSNVIAVLTRNVGSVSLSTQPPGCQVYLDSRKVAVTEPGDSELVSTAITVDGLTDGPHLLVVEHPRYYPLRKRILVQRARATRLGTLKLKKRWLPDFELKKTSGEIVRGVLKQRRPDGSILFEHSKGIVIEYKQGEIEYLKPLETTVAP